MKKIELQIVEQDGKNVSFDVIINQRRAGTLNMTDRNYEVFSDAILEGCIDLKHQFTQSFKQSAPED